MAQNVTLVESKERGTWNVIVDGEWYFEGTYEQAEKCFNTFFWPEDDEYCGDDGDEGYEPAEEYQETTEEPQEKVFIAWYRYEGEEDYMIIHALDEDEARRRFYSCHYNLTEIHEVEDNEMYLAHI